MREIYYIKAYNYSGRRSNTENDYSSEFYKILVSVMYLEVMLDFVSYFPCNVCLSFISVLLIKREHTFHLSTRVSWFKFRPFFVMYLVLLIQSPSINYDDLPYFKKSHTIKVNSWRCIGKEAVYKIELY